MMSLKIVKYGHPVLREKSSSVEKVDDEVRDFAVEMLEAMYAADGIAVSVKRLTSPHTHLFIELRP